MDTYNLLDLIPHDHPMSLLDRVVDFRENGLTAEVIIRPDSMFCEAAGVPTWVGIEYMAQGVAAYGGLRSRKENKPVQIGFLVGTRRYETTQTYFTIGSTLLVQVEQITENTTGLTVFNCKINSHKLEIQANLNVYMPDNLEDFFRDQSK